MFRSSVKGSINILFCISMIVACSLKVHRYILIIGLWYVLGTLLQYGMTDRSDAVIESKDFFSLP